ncbi:hypothetical protein ADK92_35170 [Streptomyces sp. XY533]|nr:hypothetical protein ADK92_35170 [Streptomyces sp. XY533]
MGEEDAGGAWFGAWPSAEVSGGVVRGVWAGGGEELVVLVEVVHTVTAMPKTGITMPMTHQAHLGGLLTGLPDREGAGSSCAVSSSRVWLTCSNSPFRKGL